MPAFDLPPLHMPFPSRINPHLDAANKASRSWFCSLGFENHDHVMQEYESSRSCELVARGFPNIGPVELERVTNLTFWMFLLDDGLDQGIKSLPPEAAKNRLDRMFSLISLPAHEVSADSALERCGMILMASMLDEMTPRGRARFLEEIAGLFGWVSYEVASRSNTDIPDLLSFVKQRRSTCAAMVIFRAGEYANHAELPEAFYQSQLFGTLQDSATDAIAMVNDLLSYDKEMLHAETNNYVVVCQHLLDVSIDEAVAFISRLLASRIQCFQQAQKRLPAMIESQAFSDTEHRAIRLYVEMLEHWMRANLDWSLEVPRYNDFRR
ncbi:terpene synthase family protein [Pseudomonas gingeri]